MRKNKKRIFITSALAFYVVAYAPAYAFEIYNNYPGSRAIGLAGIFSAQADDSSTVYYNPAGMSQSNIATQDWSIELGDKLFGDENYSDMTTRRGVRSVSFMSHTFPYQKTNPENQSWGMIYFEPYDFTTTIPTPRSVVDSRPYGTVRATYRQLSFAYSRLLYSNYSIGMSVDFLKTKIRCQQYSGCVDKGPYGMGFSFGLMYEVFQARKYRIKIASVWRTKVDLKYWSTTESNFTAELSKYIPDRPVTGGISVNTQYDLAQGLISVNLGLEQTQWNRASPRTAGTTRIGLNNYYKIGISAELVLPGDNQHLTAYRFGIARINSTGDYDSPDADFISIGFGYGLSEKRYIDVGLERRKLSNQFASSVNILSISYAEQL